jgi:hypothetical protein
MAASLTAAAPTAAAGASVSTVPDDDDAGYKDFS